MTIMRIEGRYTMNSIRRWLPSKIKYKLFFAILLFVFVPLFIFQIRNYSQIEEILRQKVNWQTELQIEQVKEKFNLLHTNLLTHALEIENDPRFYTWLTQGDGSLADLDTRRIEIENELAHINSRSSPNSVFVYYSLVDKQGQVFTSYTPLKQLRANDVLSNQGLTQMAESGQSLIWLEEEMGDIGVSSHNERQLSLLSVLQQGNEEPFGYLQVSFDYDSWLKSIIRDFPVFQNYFLIDADGQILSRTRNSASLAAEWIERFHKPSNSAQEYFDRKSNMLLNVQYLSVMDWKLVSQFPFDSYIGDISGMKQQYLKTYTIFIGLFVLITFVILSSLTRPLQLLQRKMDKIVSSNFRDRLNVKRMDGEVLALAQSFNRMTDDIYELFTKLKLEEKQKEAMHFQMLLSQMNPHFLLNTLNMVKWQAVLSKQDDIAEICLSLGKLLETSLNTNVDLIFAKDELELVRAYVYITQKRWQYPFEVIYLVDPSLDYVLVPKLSLQLLVENSIHHGFSKLKDKGRIVIRMTELGQKLVIEVEDNGIGLKQAEQMSILRNRKRNGIGLTNLRERLRLLYKGEASFTLEELPQGTLARATIPLLVSNPFLEGENQLVESNSG